MPRVTSPPPPAFARMTEPSQEPGCRPHLSILTDLICPSYDCAFAEEAAPAMSETASANESVAHSTNTSVVLILFIGHLPHSTQRQFCPLLLRLPQLPQCCAKPR